jgi:hypothetical protein
MILCDELTQKHKHRPNVDNLNSVAFQLLSKHLTEVQH